MKCKYCNEEMREDVYADRGYGIKGVHYNCPNNCELIEYLKEQEKRSVVMSKVVRTDLWKAMREEVKMTLDSTDYSPIEEEIDTITDKVIMDDNLWQHFNEGVLDIIDETLNRGD